MDKQSRVKKIIGNISAAMCSLFIPGLGQMLKSQWRWVVILYIIPSLINMSIQWWHGYDSFLLSIILSFFAVGLWAYTVVHAYLVPFRQSSKWLIIPLFFIVVSVNGYVQDRSIYGELPFVYGALDGTDIVYNGSPLQQDELILFRRMEGVDEEGQYWIFERENRKFNLQKKSKSAGMPYAKPLYIFWSSDLSRIGKSLEEISLLNQESLTSPQE